MTSVQQPSSLQPSGDPKFAEIERLYQQLLQWQRARDPLAAGSQLLKFVPMSLLVNSGLYKLEGGQLAYSGVTAGAGAPGPVGPIGPPGPGAAPPDPTPPPTPTGFAVVPGMAQLQLAWAAPTYTAGRGHDRTNIYGAVWAEGTPAPTFSDPRTKLIDAAVGPTTIHSTPSNLNVRWCLWIKWQSKDGFESTDPAGGINGLVAQTGQDIPALLAILNNRITQSQLAADLARPILSLDNRLDDAAANLIEAFSQIVTEGNNRAAAVLQEQVERIAGDAAEAALRTLLAAQVNDPVTGLSATRSTLLTSYYTKAATDAAIATAETTLRAEADTTEGQIYAALSTESSTRASQTGHLAAQLTTRLDLSGYVVGYGISGTSGGTAGPTSQFHVRADNFAVYAPVNYNQASPPPTPALWERWRNSTNGVVQAWNGTAWQAFNPVAFTIQTTPTVENGETLQPGMYVDAAFIKNLSAVYGRFSNLVADQITATDISVSRLTAGTLRLGAAAQSANYAPGLSGWRLSGDGDIEAENANLRGTIVARAGSIGGANIGLDYVQSTNYVAGASGWRLSPTSAQLPATSIVGQLTTVQLGNGAVTSPKLGPFVASDDFNGTVDGAGNITNDGTAGWALGKGGRIVAGAMTLRGLKSAGAHANKSLYSGAAVASATGISAIARAAFNGYAASVGVQGALQLYLSGSVARIAAVAARLTASKVGSSDFVRGPWVRNTAQLIHGVNWVALPSRLFDVPLQLSWVFAGDYYEARTRPPGQAGLPLTPILVPNVLTAGEWDFGFEYVVDVYASDGSTASATMLELRLSAGAWYVENVGAQPQTGSAAGWFV